MLAVMIEDLHPLHPLSVSTRSSGKQQLILDLPHVNQFVYKQKFKCEDVSVATQIFSRNYYLFKFDLKSGYHHVETFSWDFGMGVNRYCQFCVLPFGLPFQIVEEPGHPYSNLC